MNTPLPSTADAPQRTQAHPRILMLTYISPLQKWGSAQRTRFLIDALKRHGEVEVVVINFGRDAQMPEMVEHDLAGTRVLELYLPIQGLAMRPRFDIPSSVVTQAVSRYVDMDRYDLILSRYVRPSMKVSLPEHVPLIVDYDDAIYEPPWKALTTLKSWVGVFLRLFNDRVIVRGALKLHRHRRAHYFFCREVERREFPGLKSSVLPNLPAAPKREGPPSFDLPARPALMFIGLLDYMPNHDAVDWFLDAIWPQVRKSVPQARFLIVGNGADALLKRWAQHEGVEALGFVDSLADTYAQVHASVVPMRSGAGTNIKALEAYLYGRAVIGTPLVREGHGDLFRDGQDMLTARDADSLAKHCIDLLTHPDRASQIARNGYQRITSTLTLARFQQVVDDAVHSAWAGTGPALRVQIPQSAE